jgi:hypothetical protein
VVLRRQHLIEGIMAEIKEKHAKRIRDLIKAKWAAIVLLVGGILLPPLSPIPVLVGLLYGFEARRFLRLYPDMDSNQATDLQSAKNMYFIMAFVHMGLWVLIGVVSAIVIMMQPQ